MRFSAASNAQICVAGFWSGPSVFHRKPSQSLIFSGVPNRYLALREKFNEINDSIFLSNNQNDGSNANSGSGALVAGRVGAHACGGPAAA